SAVPGGKPELGRFDWRFPADLTAATPVRWAERPSGPAVSATCSIAPAFPGALLYLLPRPPSWLASAGIRSWKDLEAAPSAAARPGEDFPAGSLPLWMSLTTRLSWETIGSCSLLPACSPVYPSI